jgi:hypothetical protein
VLSGRRRLPSLTAPPCSDREYEENFMPSDLASQIDKLLADGAIDQTAKVAKLRQWEADALARQRASSEGMAPAASRDGADLKAIETALRSLGEDAVDQGPASI